MVDASVTLAWFFEDERDHHHDALLERTAWEPVVVPAHWWLEVVNGARIGERRGRARPEDTAKLEERIALMDVQTEESNGPRTFSRVLPLARRYGLTLYDAAYVELAERRALPLATLDGDLASAARLMGVEVLP